MAGDDNHLFNVWTCDKGGSTKVTNHINVTEKIGTSTTLKDIRKLLVTDKKLDSGKARLSFCTKAGARVGDDTKWSLYKQVVTGETKEDDGEPKSTLSDVTAHDVYFELPDGETNSKYTELSEPAKKVLETALDMDLIKNRPELITATIKGLSSSYNHSNFKAESKGEVVTAGTMSEEDWNIVLRNTHYLNGHRLVFSKNANGTRTFKRIDKAPFTAFALKSKDLSDFEKTDSGVTLPKDIVRHYPYPPYGLQSNMVQAKYKTPQFIVTDDSYVNVFETENALSSSVASSSFSQEDIKASAGGSLFGASLAVSAGFSSNERAAVAESQAEKSRNMNITYNFPRVVLHLDQRSLELTEKCKKALAKVKDEASLINFHQDFGHFFATNVELGGKLFATERFTSSDTAKASEKANAMKYSASASLSGGSFQASGSYSKETQEEGKTTKESSSMQNSLSWEACGGDTILCNNPPAWCPTVKPFGNWRVINQRDVMGIGEFIGTFEDHKGVPELFQKVKNGSAKSKYCYFRLHADQDDKKEIGPEEYYGYRENKDTRKIESFWKRYTEHVREAYFSNIMITSKHLFEDFEKLIQSESYTADWEEYIGIDKKDTWQKSGGCDFRTEVLTKLSQAPKLQYNVPYTIYNEAYKTYLMGDLSHRYQNKVFSFLYHAKNEQRATKFVFRKVGNTDVTGVIEDGDPVEMHVCDDDGDRIGQVKRSTGDYSTLGIEHYNGVNSKLMVTNNARLEYI
ncbi:hypothetical protein FQN54_009533 [Arachnomyces sp. PD_36]|nr:hypothetical protein FQN54_009533 [Arachnomyces sp. PD_36]